MDSINIKDIARMAGVGVSTVSRAINNHSDVNKETKEKILKLIEEYNYIPNNSARNLKRTNAKAIGLLVKGITNPFYFRIIKVIEAQINQNGYAMLLHQIDPREDEVLAALELTKEKRLQGIIFLGGNSEQNPALCAQFSAMNIPAVFSTTLGDALDSTQNYSSVSVDDFAESRHAVDYLCKLGHRRIAIICADEMDRSIARLRFNGYCQALADNSIALAQELVFHAEEFSLTNGYTAASELLARQKEVTAIFCVSDLIAIGACKAIFDSGLRVPEDYSVMGFDGTDYAQFYQPSLTTVKQPDEEIALESVKLLFRMMEEPGYREHKTFPAYLIEGNSCAKRSETKSS